MAYISYTTPTPGAGTVSPISTVPTPSPADADTSDFGLSTQLIIWGMVGFILFELLAIGCLLRYCCRARYLRRRKYKEKEIILSDLAANNVYNRNQSMLDNSQVNLISNSQIMNNTLADKHSLHSLKPVLYTQHQDQNETIMVDDIISDYSINHKTRNGTNRSNMTPADRMRQELTSEDIYTLKFSTNGPIEPFDNTAPKEHQSYLYNGSVNRPAFEIVSHADVRPTTPIRYEHVRDIPHSDDEYIYNERPHHKIRASRRSRAHTTPIRLNYGNEEMVNSTGKPVEWQVARELRTTDWDRIRNTYANDDNHVNSFHISRASNSDESRDGAYLDSPDIRPSKSASNLNSHYPQERFQYRDSDEQSKSLYTNYLLDRPRVSSSSKPLYQKQKSNDSLYDPKSKLSDLNETSLFEQSELHEHGRNSVRDKAAARSESDRQGALLTKIVRDPDTHEILSIKKISDDINSSINNQNKTYSSIDNNENVQYTFDALPEDPQPETDFNKSGVSVVDINYNSQSFKLESDAVNESPDLPDFPPPLGFQQSNSSNRDSISETNPKPDVTLTNVTNVSVVDVLPKRPSVSSSNHKKNDSEMDYDEEYFRPNDNINLINEHANEISLGNELAYNRVSIAERSQPNSSVVKPESSNFETGDLLSEIKSFNSGSLRPASKLSDQPLIYEKNMNLLSMKEVSEPTNEDLITSAKLEDQESNTSNPANNLSAALY